MRALLRHAFIVLLLVLTSTATAEADRSEQCKHVRVSMTRLDESWVFSELALEVDGGASADVWLLRGESSARVRRAGDPESTPFTSGKRRRKDFYRVELPVPIALRVPEELAERVGDGLVEWPAGEFQLDLVVFTGSRPWRAGSPCVVRSETFHIARPMLMRVID